MNKFMSLILPFCANKKDNDILRHNLSDPNSSGILSYIENADAISMDILKEQYEETIRAKDKLEDKAKTNIIGITITISLILGATGLLNNIYEKYNLILISWASFILFVAAVIYMLIAGIMAIKVLINENIVYVVQLKNIAGNSIDLRNDYDKCIGQNRMQNLVRNNSVYTSYECIRNGLVCLLVLLVLVTVPISLPSSNRWMPTDITSEKAVVYSSAAVSSISQNEWKDCIEKTVIQLKDSDNPNNDKPLGVVSADGKLFIKVQIGKDTITVLLVEPIEYMNPS